jgi:hypothetical protein
MASCFVTFKKAAAYNSPDDWRVDATLAGAVYGEYLAVAV